VSRLFRRATGLLVCCATAFGADVAKEYQIKAAFVYNLTKFVEWPPARFDASSDPIVIGVLGKNPFGDTLEAAVRGRKVGGREIVIVGLSSTDAGSRVHVLFVAAGQEAYFDPDNPFGALTVGESDRFTALGGMITFIPDADKVRFMINLETAEEAELKLSAQLLKLASSVRRNSQGSSR
jgi:hypothetical protein